MNNSLSSLYSNDSLNKNKISKASTINSTNESNITVLSKVNSRNKSIASDMTLADDIHPNGHRGRQYQIPKRYDNKPVLKKRNSSAHSLLNQLRATRSSTTSIESLTETKRDASNSSNKKSAERKRNSSITSIGTGNCSKYHILNTYNDSKVLETKAPGKKVYTTESAYNSPLGRRSTLPNLTDTLTPSSEIRNKQKTSAIGIDHENTLFKSLYLQEEKSERNIHGPFGRSKSFDVLNLPTLAPQTQVASHTQIGQGQPKRFTELNISSDSESIDSDNFSEEAELEENVITTVDEFSKNQITDQMFENSGQKMRTQLQKILIKEELEGDQKNDTGNAWLDYIQNSDNEITEPVIENSLSSLINESVTEGDSNNKRNIWIDVSLERRITYEKMFNDFRNVVFFNRNPMMKSIKRRRSEVDIVRKNDAFLDETGNFKIGTQEETLKKMLPL